MKDTIVAIATPAGNAGVGIVRISGDKALEIAKKITKTDDNFVANFLHLKTIFLNTFKDKAMVVYFKNPNSFTGEDVVEIQAHGGYFLLQEIVAQCINFGGRLALPGEFSKRAFLNGKMGTEQAEGIIDLINAETTMQAKMASSLLDGELGKIISTNQNILTELLAQLETNLDYPEYEFDQSDIKNINSELKKVCDNLLNLYNTHNAGMLIKNGIKVAIVGEPNVGKSSLLNALIGTDKAIVTDIAGTTRDIVEGRYEYKGFIFNLYDTAGIRKSDNKIEKIGIEKTKKEIEKSDLVLHIKDATQGGSFNIKTTVPVLEIYNKLDLIDVKNNKPNNFYISATQNININLLKEKIFNMAVKQNMDSSGMYLTNLRHINCIKNAIKLLKNAQKTLKNITIDFVISDIKAAWQQLGEITGHSATEEIIDKIFSKFCLGK